MGEHTSAPVESTAQVRAASEVRAVAEVRSVAEVRAVAWTHFECPPEIEWETDADGGSALAEFAGRSCYRSWSKPNPRTDTNAAFIRHLLDVGHLSALEHGSVSLYIGRISRQLSHELVRHRHFSFSELSQRQPPLGPRWLIEPELIAVDPQLHAKFVAVSEAALAAYRDLLSGLHASITDDESGSLVSKQARQAAAALLPAAVETAILVTGNLRAWRHFIAVRATEHLDRELRSLAIACLRELSSIAPTVFADFEISPLPDGTEVASSPLVAES
jgi:thymidylate synthase (FAD)